MKGDKGYILNPDRDSRTNQTHRFDVFGSNKVEGFVNFVLRLGLPPGVSGSGSVKRRYDLLGCRILAHFCHKQAIGCSPRSSGPASVRVSHCFSFSCICARVCYQVIELKGHHIPTLRLRILLCCHPLIQPDRIRRLYIKTHKRTDVYTLFCQIPSFSGPPWPLSGETAIPGARLMPKKLGSKLASSMRAVVDCVQDPQGDTLGEQSELSRSEPHEPDG